MFRGPFPLKTKIIEINSGVTWTGLQRGSSMPVGVGVVELGADGSVWRAAGSVFEGRQYTTIPWLMLDCGRL